LMHKKGFSILLELLIIVTDLRFRYLEISNPINILIISYFYSNIKYYYTSISESL
jgi:hypothetical protein